MTQGPVWYTQEIIRRLKEDADIDELRELIDEVGIIDAPEEIEKWVRRGNAPKSLYDAMYRFTTKPDGIYAFVDWDDVIDALRQDDNEKESTAPQH